jgi:hypothetical protein
MSIPKNLSNAEWNSLLNDIDEPIPTHMDGPTDHEVKEAIKRAECAKAGRGRIICEEALRVINGERQDAYGDPEDTFFRIACLWSSYLGREVEGSDVANMMILLKMAREKEGKGKRDNYVDLIGYAALGAAMRGYDE